MATTFKRSSTKAVDWHAVRCSAPGCGREFSHLAGVRAPYPRSSGMPVGVRHVLCSPECAEAWLASWPDHEPEGQMELT